MSAIQGPRRGYGLSGDPANRMFTTAKELLWRQRQIEVFPYDNGEVLLSLYPNAMQDVALTGEEYVQWMNVDKCLARDRSVIVELKGEPGHAFWMKFDQTVVAPNAGDSLALPDSNFHYVEISAWWDRATKIHSELGEYQDALWEFFSRADHPLLVEKYWSELLPFVDFELLPSQVLPQLNKRRVVPMPEEKTREGIINTLAGSTLLPVHTCNAWVDYEAEK